MRLIPYRLPEWKDRETVYVVEGEKDVDTLWKSGIPATCNPMGAGKWRTEFNNLFAGKKVVILPDNDPQGEQHTRTVAVNLFPVAQAVKIVPLPNLPPKGDISDWIEDGGTRDDLARIVKDTPTLPTDEIDGWKKPTYQTKRFSSLSEVPLFATIPYVQVEWTVEGLLPRASFTVIAGDPGSLKTWYAPDLARRVADGAPFAGRPTRRCKVFYLDGENPAAVVRKRGEYLQIEESENFHCWGLWCEKSPSPLGDPRVLEFARSVPDT